MAYRKNSHFPLFVLTPPATTDVALAIAACRSGRVGIFNAELGCRDSDRERALGDLSRFAKKGYGIKLDADCVGWLDRIPHWFRQGLQWVVLDAQTGAGLLDHQGVQSFRGDGGKVVLEAMRWEEPWAKLEDRIDGWWAKGHESGGLVGEETGFVLLQRFLDSTSLPVTMRGGIGVHTAAACATAGAAGAVLDSQVLLLEESPHRRVLAPLLNGLVGNECTLFGNEEQATYLRLLERPGFAATKRLREDLTQSQPDSDDLRKRLAADTGWEEPNESLLPLGQDAALAAPYGAKYRRLSRLLAAIEEATATYPHQGAQDSALASNSPLSRHHGTRYPVVQGAMTRVSDVAPFAHAVAEAGALPMIALALLRAPQAVPLLHETSELLGKRPWGVGILGFVDRELREQQLDAILQVKPPFAYIAGGRPDQAACLEEQGIHTYLHVPTPGLLRLFLDQGARSFIFEGRECGGHIGPLSSFMLWESAVTELLRFADAGGDLSTVSVLFAGGIHDPRSAAMVATLAAPLTGRGARIGVLMGTAYLFTREAVACGAILKRFQNIALECSDTSSLTTGPGHASRCARTPFVSAFHRRKRQLHGDTTDPKTVTSELDQLTLGRLRVATKGISREGDQLREIHESRQIEEGMYMIGQIAALHQEVTDCTSLHRSVSDHAVAYLEQIPRRDDTRRPTRKPADIAIVGLGTLLPKANNHHEYWRNIVEGIDCIVEIPADRWDWRLYYDSDQRAPDKIYSKWGGFLDDVPFDPTRYGMPPLSVRSIDPIQLLTLEVVRQALEDSKLPLGEMDRDRISVILGVSGGVGEIGLGYGTRSDLPRILGKVDSEAFERLPEWTEDSFAGLLPNVTAGRCANRFDFGGINNTVDAACASSLASVYQAVSDLSLGKSDLVVAGGVDTVQSPFAYLCFSKTLALSPQGKCRTFDEDSDGIAISEGLAAIVLKRLSDAERDGDRIYAVIKGAGGSSDGRAKGLTAPHPEGQIRALRRAYEEAGYSPATVGLIEAHGTGTVAGDRAELETVSRVMLESESAPGGCAIGSVKTQIGHTKSSAGICGLIKAALALDHQVLPPHPGIKRPQQVLRAPDGPLYLCPQPRPWIRDPKFPRRAGVSAFGFGGTNFHVTLEEYADEYRPTQSALTDDWPFELLLWQCADRGTLKSQVQTVTNALEGGAQPGLCNLAYSLSKQCDAAGSVRLAMVTSSHRDLTGQLAGVLTHLDDASQPLPKGVYFREQPLLSGDGRLGLLFAGQGAQYPGMMRELALHFPVLRATLGRADEVLEDRLSRRPDKSMRLSKLVYPPARFDPAVEKEDRLRLTKTENAQPAIGAVTAGLWALLCQLGIRPDMAAGHSYGEYVALYAAGVLDLDDLLRLSEARGRFIAEAAADGDLGTMIAVTAERERIETEISGVDGVVLANHNAPRQTVLSGSHEAIAGAKQRLDELDIDATPLPVAVAFHSPLVEPARKHLAQFMADVSFETPVFPVFNNTLAKAHGANPEDIRSTMADHLVQPVRFVDEILAMYESGARVFLEVGPKSIQTRLVDQILGDRAHLAVSVDDRGGGLAGLLHALAALFSEGAALDPSPLFAGRNATLVELSLDELSKAGVEPPLPPQIWLVNGTHAKRPGEIGAIGAQPTLTIERVEQMKPPLTNQLVPLIQPDTTLEVSNMSDKGTGVVPEQPPPAPGGDSVMAAYHETMRQFLLLQDKVMMSYFQQAAAGQLPEGGLAPTQMKPAALQPVQSMPPAAVAVQESSIPTAAPTPAPTGISADAEPAPVASVAPAQPAIVESPTTAGELPDTKTLLLEVASERTGYPTEMLGMDLDIEADLGIDSIKWVEILSAFQNAMPESTAQVLREHMDEVTGLRTFQAIVDWVEKTVASSGGGALPSRAAAKEEPSRPFDCAGEESLSAPLPRYLMRAHPESLSGVELPALPTGIYLATVDRLGVADALEHELITVGSRLERIPEELFWKTDDYSEWLEQKRSTGPIRGFIHLLPLGEPSWEADIALAEWRERMRREVKCMFPLLQPLQRDLSDQGRLICVSGMGGFFGRDYRPDRVRAPAFPGAAGLSGLAKSLGFEWNRDIRKPGFSPKAIDLDPARPVVELAQAVFQELALFRGRREVGYPKGQRTIFRTVPASPSPGGNGVPRPDRNWVILATGGARGITAEVLREFLPYRPTLVIVGRTPLPERESDETRACGDRSALRTYFLQQLDANGEKPKPAAIERQINNLLRKREMYNNLADFRAAEAEVDYRIADVRDGEAVAALFDDIYRQYGRIDAVIQGAGIIEDKHFTEKSQDSVDRVFDTKVDSAYYLARHLRPDSLRFVGLFTSVAGRYGNPGQTDYAAANEVVNRLALILHQRWGKRVKVAAFNWNPWGPTTHGAGMVTPEVKRQFEAKGVRLVEAAAGRRLFINEVLNAPLDEVEIIAGDCPWEYDEARLSALHRRAGDTLVSNPALPLLGKTRVTRSSEHKWRVEKPFDLVSDPYLDHHRIDGIPVLPFAFGTEYLAEAGVLAASGEQVAAVEDIQLLKGIQLECDDDLLTFELERNGDRLNALLLQGREQPQPRYRGQVELATTLPISKAYEPPRDLMPASVDVQTAYQQWLFHGPSLQTVTRLDAIDPRGLLARLRPSRPATLYPPAVDGVWLFDPALIDGAYQTVLIWSRAIRNTTPLPARVGRIERYGASPLPETVFLHLKLTSRPDSTYISGHIALYDSDKQLRIRICDFECASTSELNRVGGSWIGAVPESVS